MYLIEQTASFILTGIWRAELKSFTLNLKWLTPPVIKNGPLFNPFLYIIWSEFK